MTPIESALNQPLALHVLIYLPVLGLIILAVFLILLLSNKERLVIPGTAVGVILFALTVSAFQFSDRIFPNGIPALEDAAVVTSTKPDEKMQPETGESATARAEENNTSSPAAAETNLEISKSGSTSKDNNIRRDLDRGEKEKERLERELRKEKDNEDLQRKLKELEEKLERLQKEKKASESRTARASQPSRSSTSRTYTPPPKTTPKPETPKPEPPKSETTRASTSPPPASYTPPPANTTRTEPQPEPIEVASSGGTRLKIVIRGPLLETSKSGPADSAHLLILVDRTNQRVIRPTRVKEDYAKKEGLLRDREKLIAINYFWEGIVVTFDLEPGSHTVQINTDLGSSSSHKARMTSSPDSNLYNGFITLRAGETTEMVFGSYNAMVGQLNRLR